MNDIGTPPIAPKIKPRERLHYVSNPVLFQAYLDWYKQIDEDVAAGKDPTEMPKYIAESILKICTRLSYRPNFMHYSFKDEMILDALENVIRTARNFNPEKSNNPFSFITTIAFNAFIRRIQTEQKQQAIKGKLIMEMPIDTMFDLQDHDADDLDSHVHIDQFLRDNNFIQAEDKYEKRLAKKRGAELHEESLEDFYDPIEDLDEVIDSELVDSGYSRIGMNNV